MAQNSIDCTAAAATSLLCTESKSLCFDDLDGLGGLGVVTPTGTDKMNREITGKDLGFTPPRSEPLIALPSLSEEEFEAMILRELEYLPKGDYLKKLRNGDLDMSERREALDWIWKAHALYGFTDQCYALAASYYDRFMSVYELPRGKTWTKQLLSLACLSLAAKLEEVTVPLTVDLQVCEPKVLFEGKTIQRMELLVLSVLGWKLMPYTPYTFIDYFLAKLTNERIAFRPLIAKAVQIIISTIKGIDFLEFKPSEIAAAVALSVSGEIESMDADKAMACFKQVEKAKVFKCVEVIRNLKLMSGSSNVTSGASSSVPQSPNGVLEAACMSYKTDERTVGSCPNSSHNSPDTKRRKLDYTTSVAAGRGDLNNS